MEEDTQTPTDKCDQHIDSQGAVRDEIPIRTNARGQKRPRIYNCSSMPHAPIVIDNDVRKDNSEELHMAESAGHRSSAIDDEFQTPEIEPETERANTLPEFEEQDTEDSGQEPDLFEFLGDSIDEPIYPGHTMTVFNSVMLIWILALTHSVTASLLSDLLVLINAHCLTNVPVLGSVQRFKNFFASLKSPMTKHYFCTNCLKSVDLMMKRCPNTFCDKDLSKKNATSYYIEFPIEEQLRFFFQREEFRNLLKTRFTRKKKNIDAIDDIYDGLLYKRLSAEGQPLSRSHPLNVSFTWNTDGIPIFKSSKFSIWPMYLMINELPYNQRKDKSNMIFYGLWFGELKPSINLFCQPLLHSLEKLEGEGLDININGKTENVKGYLISGTSDLPAKATALNMVQFNGKFSCPKCLQSGKTEKNGQRGHTHIFPYDKDDPTGPARSPDNASAHALEALNTGCTVFGFKGLLLS